MTSLAEDPELHGDVQHFTSASAPADSHLDDGPHDGASEPIASGPGTRTNGMHGTLEEFNATFCFDKVLTSSDAGGHGRVVIPKVHARAYLPNLEDKQGIHVDMIDTFGTRHRFRYCSWINNSSRMYLLEGVAPALNALKLKAGDILIFGKTKQGELLLGGRARTASDKDRKAPPRTRKSDGAPGDKPVVKRRQTKKENIQFRPLCDGVFRAVPPTVNAKEFCGKILQQAGTWTAVLDLAGEAYQAFFDSQAAALEALNAAGVGNKPMPLQQAAEAAAAAAAAARYAGLPQGFGQTMGQPGASLTAAVPMTMQQLPVI
ncbi:g327 [Coccomyxa viridis]|uniref:G327 protein n=1 Tax=Coccomyxa viridis TaxID=1274662 RepID=A0ABP1FFN4_9CHLO